MEEPKPEQQRSKTGEGATPEETPALEMVEVAIGSMKYIERVVLEGVNWTVRVGDYWMLGGLQATGKSDLLATAAGLMQPLRGTYRIFGKELTTHYEHERLAARLRIGLVFDGGRLLQHLTVAENILLPLRYHKNMSAREAEEQLRALLDLIGLSQQAESYPSALALNWQQRVGLVRALTLKPAVLLLDNPLSGLDPRQAAWWLRVLDEMAAGHPLLDHRPVTVVVSGDDLRPWKGHVRQVAVLGGGRFVPLKSRAEEPWPEEALISERLGLEWGNR